MQASHTIVLSGRNHAGLQAVAEVDAPGSYDFTAHSRERTMRRLLALDCVQDPGNLVHLPPCSTPGFHILLPWHHSCSLFLLRLLLSISHSILLHVAKDNSYRSQGTLLRTAAGLGWDGAYLLPGRCTVSPSQSIVGLNSHMSCFEEARQRFQ